MKSGIAGSMGAGGRVRVHIRQRWLWLACTWLMGLSACGSIEWRPVADSRWKQEPHALVAAPVAQALAQAPDCCQTLRDLPLQDLRLGGPWSVHIGTDAPAHRFESGKSFFAAFRLADLPRPARIEVASYRSAEPGSWWQTLMPDARQAVLRPTALLLDASFRVVRRIDAWLPRSDCTQHWSEAAFELSMLLTETAEEAAYLVLLTSDESLALRGQTVCGLKREGLSPVGALELRVWGLPAHDLPLSQAYPVKWYPDISRREDVGLWSFMVAEPRLMVLGRTALHVLAPLKERYWLVHSIPYERLVWVSTAAGAQAQSRWLSLAASREASDGSPGGRLSHHLFDLGQAETGNAAALEAVAPELRSRMTAQPLEQVIAWRVLADAPDVSVEGGPGARIGQAAVAGGMVTAFPCGLCQTGACPPEMLLSCGALFSVGALLGGTAGAVREVLQGAGTQDGGRKAMSTVAGAVAGVDGLAAAGMERCLRFALERVNAVPWTDQGLTAKSVLLPVDAETGTDPGTGQVPDILAEVSWRHVVLSPLALAGSPGEPDRWVLRLEAQVRLSEPGSGRRVLETVKWQSTPHGLAAWTQPEAPLMATVAEEGCRQLAIRLIDAADRAWRQR